MILWASCSGVRIQHIVKMDPPTPRKLSSLTMFTSGIDASGLNKVADQTAGNQNGLMKAPSYSKQRWIYSNEKKKYII